MAKERVYTYYLEPTKDKFAHTNKVVSNMLADSSESSGDNSAGTDIRRDVICADKKPHNLYRVPSGMLFMLWNNRDTLDISFRIFSQEGNGTPRDITDWYKSRHTKKKTNQHGRF